MKKYLKTVCLCSVLFLAATLYSAEVIFKTKIEGPRKEYSVYKMENLRPDQEGIIKKYSRLFETVNLKQLQSRSAFKTIEDRYCHMGDDLQLSVSQNGNDLYFSNFAALKLTAKTGRLPSDEEAIKLSQKFLQEAGLTPKNMAELKIDHVGGIMQTLTPAKKSRDLKMKAMPMEHLQKRESLKGDEKTLKAAELKRPATMELSRSPEKKAVVVYFYREINGMRVMNYGSSITMTFGDEKIPAGIQYHWREIASEEKTTRDAMNPPERVYELIKEDISRVVAKDSKVVIDKIDLVLYDNGGEYIQPAYCYRGYREESGKGLEPMPILGYVPALEKVYEPIHHPAFSSDLKSPEISEKRDTPPANEKDD